MVLFLGDNMNKKIELLAPAGSFEVLKVAIQAGADAVYLAGKSFGARAFANNFSNEELKEAVEYAHIRDAKVYITVNTIIYDDEFNLLDEYLNYLASIKVDAIIVQDLGVINYVRTNFPTLVVHASTQLNIFNEEGIKKLLSLGVKRVVLARETSIDTVKKLTNLGMEIECFIHGALCFSASGNCLMSYSIGKRSGNRGECAQPCRKKYSLYENGNLKVKSKALMSMKDLYTLDNLDQLINAGIISFKIEGRMKSPEYVFATVSAYRKKVDDILSNNYSDYSKEIRKLKLTFNRHFTKGYILNENNKDLITKEFVNHQGLEIGKVVKVLPKAIEIKLTDELNLQDAIRIKKHDEMGLVVQNMFVNFEKVKSAKNKDIVKIPAYCDIKYLNAIVYKTKDANISKDLKNLMNCENIKIPLEAKLTIKKDEPLKLVMTDEKNEVTIIHDILTNVANNPKDNDYYKEVLSKLNDTPYCFSNITINNDMIAFVSIKDINQVRRKAIEEISKLRIDNINFDEGTLVLKPNKYAKLPLTIEAVVHTSEQYQACVDCGINVVYTDYDSSLRNISRLENGIFDNSLVHNLSQIGKNSVASPYFNIVNQHAIASLNSLGIDKIYLSYELDIEKLKNINLIKDYNIGLPVYGKMDAMITKHCIVGASYNENVKRCLKCINNNYLLEDEYKNTFTLFADYKHDCTNRIIDYKIRDYSKYIDEIKEKGINLFLLTFTDESYEEVTKVVNKFKNFIFEE